MSQIAKLHIRGKLVNVTARNLTLQQSLEAQNAANIAFNDPALGRARTEFCAALGRTIKNEYRDFEVALQEVLISFWMTSVDILFHRPKKHIIKLINATCSNCKALCLKDNLPVKICVCGSTSRFKTPADLIDRTTLEVEDYYCITTGNPIPERDLSIINNPIQRKRFYQTCLFNYLRQIIRENKPFKAVTTTSVTDYADDVVLKMVQAALAKCQPLPEYTLKTVIITHGKKTKKVASKPYTITAPTMLLPQAVCNDLSDITAFAAAHNVTVSIKDLVDGDNGEIVIESIGTPTLVNTTITATARVNPVSLDAQKDDDTDNTFREHIESNSDAQTQQQLVTSDSDYSDSAAVVRSRLNIIGQKVFDLITAPSSEYVDKYGDNPCKAHIAEFLGISLKEVQNQWGIIALQMRAVDLIPKA